MKTENQLNGNHHRCNRIMNQEINQPEQFYKLAFTNYKVNITCMNTKTIKISFISLKCFFQNKIAIKEIVGKYYLDVSELSEVSLNISITD
jgi:surface polysaccharide O-acyltransferase-like enzyme